MQEGYVKDHKEDKPDEEIKPRGPLPFTDAKPPMPPVKPIKERKPK